MKEFLITFCTNVTSHLLSSYAAIKTNELINALDRTQSYNLPILNEDRIAVAMIAGNLQDALSYSMSGQLPENRSVLPRDLETSTLFVEFVAE